MEQTILAPCKINLGLHVLRKREDGFRDIDTVFLCIPWSDRIDWRPAEDGVRTMSSSDPALPVDETNLCMAAALALADAAGRQDGFHLHLDKRVPYGAGLGSGSGDAAAVLKLLGNAWSVQEDLSALAAGLGSDVPFFLGAPAARGTGRGEVLEPLSDYECPFALVVAVPPVHVPTGPAYRLVHPVADGRADLVAAVRSNDLDRWRAELTNDFEEPVALVYPEVAAALERLDALGAGYSALSGSGSAVFGAFESIRKANTVREELVAAGYRTWSGFAGDPE